MPLSESLQINPQLLWLIALAIALVSAALGFLVARLRANSEIGLLKEDITRTRTELQLARAQEAERAKAEQDAEARFRETFSALSGEALKSNNETFLRMAKESLKQYQVAASADMDKREKSIHNLVLPIQEALKKTDDQIRSMEKDRKEAYGSLTQHLQSMTQTQQQLQSETRNLVQALRRPEVRGRWGELTLKRLVELAGMVEHCDFYEQEHTNTDDGAFRPDMIIRMPEKREIVVDVKTPLDAYLTAMEADTDEGRKVSLERHARQVRERVRELASKAYWQQFKNAPDFVVLFIPGEQFLSAALDLDQSLLEDALRDKVILATPTSFIALLRAVGYGWRQLSVAENAELIRDLGADLYKRLSTFGDHLGKLGKTLGSSVDNYNKAVGSLERQVLPGARRFEEMGISVKKELPALDPIEKAVRDSESQ